jgi:hypothetical protein
MHSRRFLSMCAEGDIEGIEPYCDAGTRALYEQNCGDPTGYYFLY